MRAVLRTFTALPVLRLDAEVPMTDRPDPGHQPINSDPASVLARRWAYLDADERVVVDLAITEMHNGTFTTRAAWERFADAALELLPSLRSGSISAVELHELALGQAVDDHD